MRLKSQFRSTEGGIFGRGRGHLEILTRFLEHETRCMRSELRQHVHACIEPIFWLNAYLSHYCNPQLSDYVAVDLQFRIVGALAAV